MRLGELREHPDFVRLIKEVQKRVDTADANVLQASVSGELSDLRLLAGGRMALAVLLDDLKGKGNRYG